VIPRALARGASLDLYARRFMAKFLYLSLFLVLLSASINALALPWIVLQKTGSVLVTGFIGFFSLSAIFLGSLMSRRLIQWLGADGLIIASFVANILVH